MEEETVECKICDHCKLPFVVTRTKVVCATCKALFCTSRCKKEARKEHKKCSNRPHFEPPKPEIIPPPEDTLVIEDEEIRNLLFGDTNQYKCGYHDGDNVLQPATTPERASEILAHHYQRLRSFYIQHVPSESELRATGVLHLHFMDFIDLATAFLKNVQVCEIVWMPLDGEMVEKAASLELGAEYFGLTFTVGPRGGPYICNRTLRFLYKGMQAE